MSCINFKNKSSFFSVVPRDTSYLRSPCSHRFFYPCLVILVLLGAPVIREVLVATGTLVVIHAVVAAGPAVGDWQVTRHWAAVHAPAMWSEVVHCSAVPVVQCSAVQCSALSVVHWSAVQCSTCSAVQCSAVPVVNCGSALYSLVQYL